MDSTLNSIFTAILDGDALNVRKNIQAALESGTGPAVILNDAMIAAMKEVGDRFENGEYFVPEMLISARAMKEGLALLKPLLISENIQSAGKVVIGTVKGDLHDIGKNLVSMMLEGAGFEVYNLGTDVSAEAFVKAVHTSRADIVAMSALLTTTMPNMKTTLDALRVSGLRSSIKVMVGGAPVTENFANQIGADGFAPDASRAVQVAKALCS